MYELTFPSGEKITYLDDESLWKKFMVGQIYIYVEYWYTDNKLILGRVIAK